MIVLPHQVVARRHANHSRATQTFASVSGETMTDLFENYTPPWMDEELVLLRDAARKFFTTELAPHHECWEANGMVDRDAWSKTGAAGFLLAEMPVAYGGGGGDYRHETVIMEEQLRCGASGLGTQLSLIHI